MDNAINITLSTPEDLERLKNNIEYLLTISQRKPNQGAIARIRQYAIANNIHPNDVEFLIRDLIDRLEYRVRFVSTSYSNDLAILDGNWELDRIISDYTVFIVVGTWLGCELLDRPCAELLEQAINDQGDYSKGKRAIICTDTHYNLNKDTMNNNPTIAVGGSTVNTIATCENQWSCLTSGKTISLWGETSTDTRDAVEQFVLSPDGLKSFLQQWW